MDDSISASTFFAQIFAHPLEFEQIRFGELVNIGYVLDQAAIAKLVHQSITQAVNVHHTARGEVQDGLAQLRGTVRIHTAIVDLALAAHARGCRRPDSFPAYGTFLAARVVAVLDHPVTLGMTSPPRSTSTQSPIFTPRRSISSRLWRVARLTVVPPIGTGFKAATGVSFPVRPACTRMSSILVTAGAGGVLVGDRPTRSFAGVSQFILQRGAVHFDDDAIDFIAQAFALAFPFPE